MSDETQEPQEFHVEGSVQAVQPDDETKSPQGSEDPNEVNFETPQDAQDNPNDDHVAAESHFDENPPVAEVEGPTPGSESESTIAHDIANQPRFPAHQPAVDQAANIEGDILPPQPIKVDGRSRRSDDDALEGGPVDIVDGEHAGKYGAFVRVLQHAADGYPKQILVRTRDAENELLSIAYDHVRPSKRTGGR